MLFLSCPEAEIFILPVLSQPSLIFHFRAYFLVSALPSPTCLASEMASYRHFLVGVRSVGFPVSISSDEVGIGSVRMLDPENVRLAVTISSLSFQKTNTKFYFWDTFDNSAPIDCNDFCRSTKL